MRLLLGCCLVVVLLLVAAVRGDAAASGVTGVSARFAHTWTVKGELLLPGGSVRILPTFATNADAETAPLDVFTLRLAPSLHFPTHLTGAVVVNGTESELRFETAPGKLNSTIFVKPGFVADDSTVDITQVRVELREVDANPAALAAAGKFVLGEAFASFPLEQAWPADLGAVKPKPGDEVAYALTSLASNTFTLKLRFPGEWSLSLVAVSDESAPALPWWQRLAPSVGMFVVFMVMRMFQGFVENRQEQKAVLKHKLANAPATQKQKRR